jgi:hypothetical protein
MMHRAASRVDIVAFAVEADNQCGSVVGVESGWLVLAVLAHVSVAVADMSEVVRLKEACSCADESSAAVRSWISSLPLPLPLHT